MYIDHANDWVPYKGEPLWCVKCGSRNTERVKQRTNGRRNAPKRDVLICGDCGHITDRWRRTEGVQ